LRREIDLVDRAIRHGVIGFQHQIGQNVSNGDTNGIRSYHRGVRMHGAALRLRTLTLLTGISGILMLLGMDSTADKPCVLRKAEHRLRKKDENCAKAQRKKLIFAGNFHESFPYLSVPALSTPASALRITVSALSFTAIRTVKISLRCRQTGSRVMIKSPSESRLKNSTKPASVLEMFSFP